MTDSLREITGFLLYQTEDGCIRIETRMQEETVWLTQDQIAQLFSKDILEEFFKDHIEEYNGVVKKEQKQLTRKLSQECAELICLNFMNIVDGEF